MTYNNPKFYQSPLKEAKIYTKFFDFNYNLKQDLRPQAIKDEYYTKSLISSLKTYF